MILNCHCRCCKTNRHLSEFSVFFFSLSLFVCSFCSRQTSFTAAVFFFKRKPKPKCEDFFFSSFPRDNSFEKKRKKAKEPEFGNSKKQKRGCFQLHSGAASSNVNRKCWQALYGEKTAEKTNGLKPTTFSSSIQRDFSFFYLSKFSSFAASKAIGQIVSSGSSKRQLTHPSSFSFSSLILIYCTQTGRLAKTRSHFCSPFPFAPASFFFSERKLFQ